MNQDILEGKLKQLKGKAHQQWGKLTNDDLDRITGKREELVGVVQERYGWAREKAESEVDEFIQTHNLD
ncbi:MAG: CsbD family protein [Candidatus Promineifilaceae bacterium]